jgi:methylated-DNA-protein-cysteine methyltransferase-like protein
MTFQEGVLALCAEIPRGRVMSYGQIASILGFPRGARAVGGALHVAPGDRGLPWWRVIASNGRISTAEAGGHAQAQQALLEDDGVAVGPGRTVAIDALRWWPDPELEERLAEALHNRHGLLRL